jgi:hypothetical protein
MDSAVEIADFASAILAIVGFLSTIIGFLIVQFIKIKINDAHEKMDEKYMPRTEIELRLAALEKR